MGTPQPMPKGNKNTKSFRCRGGGRLFSFAACFGLSCRKKHKKNLYQDPISSAAAVHDHGDGVETAEHGRNMPKFAESDIPTSESIKEIQIIAAAAAEAMPPHLHGVNNKISVDQDIITEEKNKNKNEQERSISVKVQEILSNPTKLTHSFSLPGWPSPPPQPRPKKRKTASPSIGKGVNVDGMTAAAGKFDSMAGASLITFTLVVMLIWGKACAILCSAAWIFFIHCFKRQNESLEHKKVSDHQILDLDSHEYKNRVVLQGFLERI